MARARSVIVLIGLILSQVLQPTVALATDPSPAPSPSPSPGPSSETGSPGGLSPESEALLAGTRVEALSYGSPGYRYKVVAHGAVTGFEATGFDDVAAGFADGEAAFASSECGGPFETSWTGTTDILLRRDVSLPAGTQDVRVSVAIDNDIQVFWNGVDVSNGMRVSENCAVKDEYTFSVPASAVTAGDNLLAARARNRSTASHVNLRVTVDASGVTAPSSCDDEDLYAHVDPLSDGRVTVVYDPRFLVDPAATAGYLADAERIARRVQERAEAALDRYDVLLGSTEITSHTPPNVTIEIRCQLRLEVLGDFPVYDIDRPGFTGDSDDVQLRSDVVRAEFAPAVTGPRDTDDGDFLPGQWDSPPARWTSDVDHEIFHTVQHHGQPNMGADYLLRSDAANLEAAAVVAQDLFDDADDDGVDEAGAYWEAVLDYFTVPGPVTTRHHEDPAAYSWAPVLQYLGERYGALDEPDTETRVASFLHRMITSDAVRIGQLRDAMLSEFDTVAEALRDFGVAAYVNDKPTWADYPAQFRILDEADIHAATNGNVDYPTFLGVTGPAEDNDLSQGGAVSLDAPLGEGEAHIFEIDIAPDVLMARISLHAWAAQEEAPAVAIMPVNADGSVDVDPANMPRWLVRAEYQEPITVPVGGRSKLAVVVGATAPRAVELEDPLYELNVRDVTFFPSIEIRPESSQPTSIGPGPDFDPIQILARPLANGERIPGLTADAFDMEIGGLEAEVQSVVRITADGSYALLVQPPSTLGVGAHDLTVTLAAVTSDLAPGAIIVEESAAFSAQSLTTGLTGFLHLETIGEVGMPVQVRYILADRSGPITGATATAVATDPNGVERSVSLVDDGGHGDGGTGDGVYGAALWSSATAGIHNVVASATGEDSSGTPFTLDMADSVSLGAKTDGDGDGIADGIEAWYLLDPADGTDAAGDADGDGQSTAQELAAGTNPFVPDSDGGGETDGSEIGNARDPLNPADDGAATTPTLSATLRDGSVIEIRAATTDGSGSVQLTRVAEGVVTPLGTHPGSGVVLSDGPLVSGEYGYVAVAVGPDGSESPPFTWGPVTPVADATPPDGYLVVNGGAWNTADTEVAVAFSDLSEQPSEMRLALDRESLEQAPWVPYQATSIFVLPAELGLHITYAELKDAGGNRSRVMRAISLLADTTPPVSTAGPLQAAYEVPSVDVPYAATDDLTGVDDVELWWRYRVNAGSPWSTWAKGPTASASPIPFAFPSGPGEYQFYTVAIDGIDNREASPAAADASTLFDPPPTITASLTEAPVTCTPRPCPGRVKVTGAGAASDHADVVTVHYRTAPVTLNGGAGTWSTWKLATATDGAFNELSEPFTASLIGICQYGWHFQFRVTAGADSTTIQRTHYCGSGGPGAPAP